MEFGSEIIKVLDYLGEKLGMTIDWSNKNVMPYVERFNNTTDEANPHFIKKDEIQKS